MRLLVCGTKIIKIIAELIKEIKLDFLHDSKNAAAQQLSSSAAQQLSSSKKPIFVV